MTIGRLALGREKRQNAKNSWKKNTFFFPENPVSTIGATQLILFLVLKKKIARKRNIRIRVVFLLHLIFELKQGFWIQLYNYM